MRWVGGGGLAPRGMPLVGRLTQDAHPGQVALDLATQVGMPVNTTMDGRVVFTGWSNEGYGKLVIVENGPYRTYYTLLSEIPVMEGQFVRSGVVVGYLGTPETQPVHTCITKSG